MKQDLDLKIQVREILNIIQVVAPGKSVELRIPPYAVIQCMAGSVHRRGTPSNVVEMSGQTLIELFENPARWDEFYLKGFISASGTHANLKELFTEASKLSLGSK